MMEFVARYQGSTKTHPGIEIIQAETAAEILEKSRAIATQTGLPLTLISVRDFGELHQIWNAQRAAKRNGNGWREDTIKDIIPGFLDQ